MKKLFNLFVKIITNNTGVSSKSFIMVCGMLLAAEVTQVMLAVTVWDFIVTGVLNYTGIGILLAGLSAFVLASAWGKAKTDMAEAYYNTETIPIVD